MTELKKACTFVLFLAIVVITTAQIVFTASHSKMENINEVDRSPKLGYDLWATLLPERQNSPQKEVTCESLQELEPRPHVLVVHITPEVVYIGDTFSNFRDIVQTNDQASQTLINGFSQGAVFLFSKPYL